MRKSWRRSSTLRDRIINQLILRGIETLQVSEYKTSSGSRLKTHLHAATRIALMGGSRIYSLRDLNPTDGDLKEIQRQSRIQEFREFDDLNGFSQNGCLWRVIAG